MSRRSPLCKKRPPDKPSLQYLLNKAWLRGFYNSGGANGKAALAAADDAEKAELTRLKA